MEANMIDVANYQGSLLNFGVLKSYGILKCAIKYTEGSASGTDYKNEFLASQTKGALAAGLTVMPYHYFLGISPSDAQEEADFFLSVVESQGLSKGTPLALDVEDPSIVNSSLVANVDAFFNRCWDKGYKNLFIYGSLSWFQEGLLTPSNFTHKPKTWVAAYPYGEANKSSRPYNCDVWQFSSSWGTYFGSGYSGGSGLDVSWDYDNAVKNLDSTIGSEDETVAYPEIASDSYGVLVFSKDTKVGARTFKKGSGWNIVNNFYRDGHYDLGGNTMINPGNPQQSWIYVQPSPFNPSLPYSAKGLAVRVKYANGYGVALRQEPKDSAPFSVRPKDAYMPSSNNPQDGVYYVFREQGSWRVVGVDTKTADTWICLGTNCWAKIKDFNVVIGE